MFNRLNEIFNPFRTRHGMRYFAISAPIWISSYLGALTGNIYSHWYLFLFLPCAYSFLYWLNTRL